MTEWGGKIPDLTVEELQAKLADTEDDGKAVKRLIAAIAYKQGHSPAEIEETFGFSKQNVYLWLDRFEDRELDDALAALTRFRVELGHLEGALQLCARCTPGGPATYWTRDLESHVVE